MKTALDWLSSEITVVKLKGIETFKCQVTIIERLTELIMINGGSASVTRWGKVEPGIGHYGRMGLTLSEAMELVNLGGIFHGYLACQEDEAVHLESINRIKAEFEKVKKTGFDPFKGLVGESEERKPTIDIYSEDDMKKIAADKNVVEPKLRV